MFPTSCLFLDSIHIEHFLYPFNEFLGVVVVVGKLFFHLMCYCCKIHFPYTFCYLVFPLCFSGFYFHLSVFFFIKFDLTIFITFFTSEYEIRMKMVKKENFRGTNKKLLSV